MFVFDFVMNRKILPFTLYDFKFIFRSNGDNIIESLINPNSFTITKSIYKFVACEGFRQC